MHLAAPNLCAQCSGFLMAHLPWIVAAFQPAAELPVSLAYPSKHVPPIAPAFNDNYHMGTIMISSA